MDILRGSVDGDAIEFREYLSGIAADFSQIRRAHGDGIAGGKEQGTDRAAVGVAGRQDVGLYLRRRTNFKAGPLLVYHAEGAAVVRTSDRGLDQQGICLTGRTIYGAVVAHHMGVFEKDMLLAGTGGRTFRGYPPEAHGVSAVVLYWAGF